VNTCPLPGMHWEPTGNGHIPGKEDWCDLGSLPFPGGKLDSDDLGAGGMLPHGCGAVPLSWGARGGKGPGFTPKHLLLHLRAHSGRTWRETG